MPGYQILSMSRRAPGVVTADAGAHAAEGRAQQRAGRADPPPIDPSLSSCIMAAQDAYLLERWPYTPTLHLTREPTRCPRPARPYAVTPGSSSALSPANWARCAS